jgi:hypothetical protein
MKYVHCSRCRARFHTGVIYEPIEECARCDGPLLAGTRLRDQLRARLHRRRDLDWEAITGSQYVSRLASPSRGGQPGS